MPGVISYRCQTTTDPFIFGDMLLNSPEVHSCGKVTMLSCHCNEGVILVKFSARLSASVSEEWDDRTSVGS